MKSRTTNRLVCGVLCAAGVAAFATTAKASTILSDNFEGGATGASSPNVDSNAFPNWTEQNETTPPTMSNPIKGHDIAAPTALDGKYSMEVENEVYQAFTPTTSAFDVSFEFAALNPGSSNRTMTMYLADDAGANPYVSTKINFRLYNDGTNNDIQVYQGSGYITIGTFNNNDYSANLNTPTINTLSVDGTFDGLGSSYSITFNGTTYSGLTGFQKGTASGSGNTPADLASIDFGVNTNANFVVDDVSVTGAPEPASLALIALGALGMLTRPRRRNRTASPC